MTYAEAEAGNGAAIAADAAASILSMGLERNGDQGEEYFAVADKVVGRQFVVAPPRNAACAVVAAVVVVVVARAR